jgi:imidazolonepropionase-like amidohydrolase
MPYNYALAERGKTLATRQFGSQLRDELMHSVGDQSEVVLDFTDVLSTSHSFADEFVACLAEEVRAGKLSLQLHVEGASPDVERVIQKALERRGLEVPVVV